ncbi:MAG: PKD domain-containing protein [Gammaproteobacteria bacterium]
MSVARGRFTLLVFGVLLTLLSVSIKAATPANGTLTDSSGPLTYTTGPFPLANPTPAPLVDAGPECNNPEQPCDDYALTVSLPSNYATTYPNKLIQFKMSWTDTGAGTSDYDLYVYAGTVTNTDGSQAALTQSASGANPEVATLRVFNGTKTFTLKVVPYTPSGETVNVQVSLVDGPASSGGSTGFGGATPTAPGVPRYQNFMPPNGSAANGGSGEFSIGFDPKTQNILTLSDLDTFRVTPPERRNPSLPESGPALWTNVSPSIVSVSTLDPILFTDQTTGRTFESMQTTGAEVLFGYTDDDGATWIQASAAPPNGGIDHETVGAGPYPAPLAGLNAVYPNAVYYCSQALFPDFCQRSDDGGVSFAPGTPADTGLTTACGGLHGHVKVAPDGTVYLPVAGCGDQQGGAVSTDAGNTWSEFLIPGSQSFVGGSTDPSIAIDQNNTAYDCYVDGQGVEHHVHVAVSHDHGKTWINDTDIGAPVGVVMAVFPEAVAGSPGRAACGFVGSNVAGDHESLAYPGFWYLFIATTYDGGQTWTTVNATPNDPVQGAGGIWNSGGGHQNRNLLDFNEVTMDDHGRVLFGYDDGCVTDTCISDPTRNDFVAYQRVARQTGGEPLLARFDTVEPATPKAPYLEGTRTSAKADLDWNVPDNGGADISAYKILRGTGSGTESLIATVSGDKTRYEDASVDPSVPQYFYKVIAVNAIGDGSVSNEVSLSVTTVTAANACDPPGLTILTDATGDSLSSTPGTDLKSFQLAQPYATDGNIKLRFQINTDPGQEPQPPQSYWYVSFKESDGTVHGVRMTFTSTSPATPTFESYVAGSNSSGAVDGRFVKSGSEKPADPSSFYDASNGTIVIVVPISDLGLTAGEAISGFNSASVQAVNTSAGGVAETVDEMPDGLAYQGSFAINPNSQCVPNNPPVAVFNATPADDIAFDASASYDPDSGDPVASYTFNFSDATVPLTQSVPTAYQTYQNPGNYPVFNAVAKSNVNGNGDHTVELRNVTGAVYVDRFCIAGASSRVSRQPRQEIPGPTLCPSLQARLRSRTLWYPPAQRTSHKTASTWSVATPQVLTSQSDDR